jgi:hypothetical protein
MNAFVWLNPQSVLGTHLMSIFTNNFKEQDAKESFQQLKNKANPSSISNKFTGFTDNTSNNNINTYSCPCGKTYKHSSTLYAHKKKCKLNSNADTEENIIISTTTEISEKDLIMLIVKQNTELIKENNEFKNMMMKVIENGTHNTTNNTTNSHNKAFNLNFFLNETCKDAMNIMDFVDSIKLQLSDLEKVGELGYVEGISNIIVKNLNELDVTLRPVHCTDKKRETMYIKDEDKWEKDESNSKIKKAIKRVASKNQRLLPKFKEAHPDCGTYHSKYSDQYNKIIIESVGGSGDNDAEKEEKIIRNITRATTIEK